MGDVVFSENFVTINKKRERGKRSARGKSWEEKINLCNLFIKIYALFHKGPL